MTYCFTANAETSCSEHCKECAKGIYHELKDALGNAEYISENAIIDRIGEIAFKELKRYGFIEACGVVDGTKVYAL